MQNGKTAATKTEAIKKAIDDENEKALIAYRTELIVETAHALLDQNLKKMRELLLLFEEVSRYGRTRIAGKYEVRNTLRDILSASLETGHPLIQAKLLDLGRLSGRISLLLREMPGSTIKEIASVLDEEEPRVLDAIESLNREGLLIKAGTGDQYGWFLSQVAHEKLKDVKRTILRKKKR